MTTKLQLQNELKDAMRQGDEVRKSTIRMALSAIKLAEVEKREELDENEVLAILQREMKARQEAIEDAKRANRPELVSSSEQEMAILKRFLPEQLSAEELENLAKQVIEELGATSMREMGQVMKTLLARLEGRATGSQASEVVRKLLA